MKDSEKYKGEYIKVTLNSPINLFQLNYKFLAQFVFRGHADSDWELKTPLYRCVERYHDPKSSDLLYTHLYEQEMIKEFKQKYNLYEKTNIPSDLDVIAWLSIMQHYGVPTRMIDFSHSMFVALYFAVYESFSKESTIWCLNRISSRFQHNFFTKEDGIDTDTIIYNHANKVMIDNSRKPEKHLYLVEPPIKNNRISFQQGLFAIPEIEYLSLIDNLSSILLSSTPREVDIEELVRVSKEEDGFNGVNYLLIEIRIPSKFRFEFIHLLRQMNITTELIYPGLEGFAKSLKYPHYENLVKIYD